MKSRRPRTPLGWRELNAMAERYAVRMMGLARADLYADQEANQTLRHLFQFGRRVQRRARR